MKKRIFVVVIVVLLLFGAAGCGGGAADNAPPGIPSAPDCGGPTGVTQDTDDTAGGTTAAGDNGAAGSAVSNAPDFPLQDLEGNTAALSDFAGRVVVLNFWASWCPPCRQEMPDLNELDQELKESGAAVLVTVNLTDGLRETRDTATQYIEENGFGFTVLFDDQGLLANEYNVSAIPQTFILDREGNVVSTIIGATTKAAIMDKVNAVE